ncbi:putative ectonucleoside triphosphate diphosphohydrolase 4 [Scophthalmus maximus]|uniref:nucleoside-triphosphate phosphatase n=1 Tax=Scophthalmus maximus TaxID=52904 RepID=A0A2U9BRQ3_SCOMX|nr:putative ectonucleoside triphosphate diphosphohydrolase 4 [Scophthalmus maximus]
MPLFRALGERGAARAGRRGVRKVKRLGSCGRTDEGGSAPSLTQLCLLSLADNMKDVWVKDYADKYLDQYSFRHIMGPFNSLPAELVEELTWLLCARKQLSRAALHLLLVPQLRGLSLERCPGLVTSALCAHIAARCQGLWSLDLSGAQQLPSKVLSETLCSLPALRSLSLAGMPCDRCVIRTIACHCHLLRHLDVSRCHFLSPASLLPLGNGAFDSTSAIPSSSSLCCTATSQPPISSFSSDPPFSFSASLFSYSHSQMKPVMSWMSLKKGLKCLLIGCPLLEKLSLVSLPCPLNCVLQDVLHTESLDWCLSEDSTDLPPVPLGRVQHIDLQRTDVKMITVKNIMQRSKRLKFVDVSYCWQISQASWHFSLSSQVLPRLLVPSLRQLLFIGLVLGLIGLLYLLLATGKGHASWIRKENHFHRHLARVTDVDATDTSNPNLNYGLVVDCGSSGSRVFVYCWPRHNGNPHELLDIQQMRDQHRKPVVMKIKPGISELAKTPEKASNYIYPLLSFAAQHVPKNKHKETPLYILCTAGMRILPESQQEALLEDLRTDIPVHFNFLFSDSHVEVISGKQEGVYAWIGINFVLGRFNHVHNDGEAVVEVHVPGSEQQDALVRKRTASVLDMGGVSTQIAYEVPKTEEVAKNLLAEFNLGCDAHRTEHVYRVYVSTFLGFGGNAARQRYEENLIRNTATRNKLLGQHKGETAESPLPDPCLPSDLQDEIGPSAQKLHLRGTGDFDQCRLILQPFLNCTNETQTSLSGIYQPAIDYTNSQFYGFSEFYYCTEDVLRMGGDYNASKYAEAAKSYCATRWKTLRERFDSGLYASHADLHRLKYQCFKSAWMYEVLHSGFSFPTNYKNLKTALLVYDKEVQWTLGAILYRTRFLPLRDIQQEALKGAHSHWRHSFSFVNNHYLFLACFFIVLLSIMLYLMRLRRIHRHAAQPCTPSSVPWLEDGLGSPTLPVNL